ncbi:Fanconi anemia core complex-associated protein 100 [Oryzias melastigma]|uniref:FA core complex associated protein 100 n=1 Tax=Oryzias melastigma TaxID=30732 RepID=A0A3B3D6C9_ORYME|nr:Fanconi anemia core complex-associated protein 100 [Oryzias melastigma]
MEGRCAVDTWTEFGFLRASSTPKVKLVFGTHVICTGDEEVYVFSVQEKNITAVLQFPEEVVDLIESHNKHLLIACSSGVYCVDLQPLLVSSSADASSGPAELKISSEFCVLGGHGLSSLLLVGSTLLTLGQRNTSWMLTLYKLPQPEQPSSYEMLGSFSLPLLSPVLLDRTETEQTRRSLLICLHSGSPPASNDSYLTHGQFGIQPVLFKLLFGVDAALARSPVLLWGLPDGRLCFLPLHLPGSQIRVLHSLEQPVAFVGASVVGETDPGLAQCLVVVGERGRVVLIRTDRSGSETGGSTAGFAERCVPGPVKCCSVDNNCLYYSTGSDLLRLNLLGSSGREDGAVQMPTTLNVCRIIALVAPTCNPEGGAQLIGLSDRGKLSGIKLPVGEQEVGFYQLPATQVGRSVKDLLSAIGDICERASALKTVIKSQNVSLKRLNQVVNICLLLKSAANTDEHRPIKEKPIRCCATAEWSRLLLKDSLNLTCVLENSSPYTLERGWTLCITVSPLSCSPGEGDETSSTFAFPVINLSPGGALEVSVPVAAAGDAAFPLTVNCWLVFSLLSVLEEEDLESLQSRHFTFPLNSLTVDWLHILREIGPTVSQKSQGSTTDAIEEFVSSRRIDGHKGANGGRENATVYSTSVRVSPEILRDTLKTERFGLGTSDLHLSLLNWLFESHGGVKMGRRGDQDGMRSSEVHARSPNEATVKLSVKEVNEENSGKEAHVEVQIESSSVAAVCGLHHAVLRRMQSLLVMVPMETAAAKKIQISDLKLALQRAEIQQSGISDALGSDVSSAQMNSVLLDVYQKLRENRLLMI